MYFKYKKNSRSHKQKLTAAKKSIDIPQHKDILLDQSSKRKFSIFSLIKKIIHYVLGILHTIHRFGCEKVMFVVVPHTEKRIINWHMNFYALFCMLFLVCTVVIFSIVNLVIQSGENIQFHKMGMDNKYFNKQSVLMSKEIVDLHKLVENYTNTILEIKAKVDDKEKTFLEASYKQAQMMKSEMKDLLELTNKCEILGDECSHEMAEEIMRSILHISKKDNFSLNQALEASSYIIREIQTKKRKLFLKTIPNIWPTNGYLLSSHGWQRDILRGHEVFKRGIEIGTLPGTAVRATASGTIYKIEYDPNYGLCISLVHMYGISTFYAHLDRVLVKEGDRIKKHSIIGHTGQTGIAPTHMLYYEIHVGTVAYNPHAFLNHLE